MNARRIVSWREIEPGSVRDCSSIARVDYGAQLLECRTGPRGALHAVRWHFEMPAHNVPFDTIIDFGAAQCLA